VRSAQLNQHAKAVIIVVHYCTDIMGFMIVSFTYFKILKARGVSAAPGSVSIIR
jgi:hypothetical protein